MKKDYQAIKKRARDRETVGTCILVIIILCFGLWVLLKDFK